MAVSGHGGGVAEAVLDSHITDYNLAYEGTWSSNLGHLGLLDPHIIPNGTKKKKKKTLDGGYPWRSAAMAAVCPKWFSARPTRTLRKEYAQGPMVLPGEGDCFL